LYGDQYLANLLCSEPQGNSSPGIADDWFQMDLDGSSMLLQLTSTTPLDLTTIMHFKVYVRYRTFRISACWGLKCTHGE
jgi:hypothetical protein